MTNAFEKTSRAIFKFNMGFDNAILEPIAKGYNKFLNQLKMEQAILLKYCYPTFNSKPLLQGNFKDAGDATASFLINTTIGIVGLANPAEKLGLKAQKEDVGQTLERMDLVLVVICFTCIRSVLLQEIQLEWLLTLLLIRFAHITWRENELLGVSGNRLII